MPFVSGVFSALDLRSVSHPSLEITTAVHATRTTHRQAVAWVVAVLGIAAVLGLLCFGTGRRPARAVVREALRWATAHAGFVDAVVASVLVVWWVIAPAVWDDGWIVARERAYVSSGGFSTYYSTLGVNLPLDYWVEWLHHWIADHSSSVLLLRLPTLVCLSVVWVLCRWAFGRVRAAAPEGGDGALWALAGGFLVFALAWGMTLRPEPVVALLAMGVMACAVRFAQRENSGPLAIAAVLVPLALTAHHTGIVALAPVLAISPRLALWARPRLAEASAITVASAALLLVLAFVGSDADQRGADARTTSLYGITQPWRDVIRDYALLGDFPWATPVRRASIALIALTLLAFASRRRGGRSGPVIDLPATTLAIALVLLIATPSKLPWHFGALTGIAALAIATETVRIRQEGTRSHGWRLRPILMIGAVILAAAWFWWPRYSWNPADLRTISWDPGWDAMLPFTSLAIALPAVVLGAEILVGLRRGRRNRRFRAPWVVAGWTVPLLAGPLVVFTVGVLITDAQRTDGWTLARQNLGAIVRSAGCGLADDGVPAMWRSAIPLASVGPAKPAPMDAWVPDVPVAGLRRFELSSSSGGSVSTPWFRLPADRRLGLFVAGASIRLPGSSRSNGAVFDRGASFH